MHALVPALQALVPGIGRNAGRARLVDLSHDNPSLGSAVCTGVRQTLVPLRGAGRHLLTSERGVRENLRPVGLPLSAVDASGKTVDFRLSLRRCRAGRPVSAAWLSSMTVAE